MHPLIYSLSLLGEGLRASLNPIPPFPSHLYNHLHTDLTERRTDDKLWECQNFLK
jgi:hypothetical protein